jgi:hypothetical protein
MAYKFFDFKKHAVAGSTRLTATNTGEIYNIQAAADIDNGAIVGKGAYVKPHYYAEAAAGEFEGNIIGRAGNGNWYVEVKSAVNCYLVLSVPELYADYTEEMKHESNFYNAKGDLMRCYQLFVNDVFEVSAEAFTGTPVAGKTVSVADKKLSVAE